MARYAGVDFGATNLRVVIGTPDGEIQGADRRPTPQGPSGITVTEAILDTIRAACNEADIEPTELVAAGVGSIGPLDTAEGAVRNPANLPDTIDLIPITGPVENLIDGPVYLHNDANAGAIGERFYADYSPDNIVYLTISSGIGAGVIVDGAVLSGWDGNAGEVGHITVDPDGLMECGCGKRGHWEAYCSGNNIPRYAQALHNGEETALTLDDPDFGAADVFAQEGSDAFADRVLDKIAAWNAQGAATLTHAYAPIVIYVGGAVAINNPEFVINRLRERIADLVMTNVPDIKLTTLGNDVVVKGALASAMTSGTGDKKNLRE